MLLLLLGLVVAMPTPNLDDEEGLFEEFVAEYHKSYKTAAERLHRFAIFKQNLARVRALNARRTSPTDAVFGVTFFTDLLPSELPVSTIQPLLKEGVDSTAKQATPQLPPLPEGDDLPTQFSYCGDFVANNVDRPKIDLCAPSTDQQSCGCCYAASLGNLGQYLYANMTYEHNKNEDEIQRVKFGFQRYADTNGSRPHMLTNKRCCGGNTMLAIEEYMTWSLEEDYPFVDGQSPAAQNCVPPGDKNPDVPVHLNARDIQTWSVEYDNVDKAILQIKKILHHYGPQSVAINSRLMGLGDYKGGIIDADDICGPAAIPVPTTDHKVLLVGWGKEGDTEFWIAQNSWYPRWGISAKVSHGYFRFKTSSLCGMGYAKENYIPSHVGMNGHNCLFMKNCKTCDQVTKNCTACVEGATLTNGACFGGDAPPTPPTPPTPPAQSSDTPNPPTPPAQSSDPPTPSGSTESSGRFSSNSTIDPNDESGSSSGAVHLGVLVGLAAVLFL